MDAGNTNFRGSRTTSATIFGELRKVVGTGKADDPSIAIDLKFAILRRR